MSAARAGSLTAAWLAAAVLAGCGGDDGAPGTNDARVTDALAVDGPLDAAPLDAAPARMIVTSPVFTDGGTLPARFTCDGAGVSPPLAWSGTPPGTAELALLMTTMAPDGLKWNWVLYHLPAATTSLTEATTLGTAGRTSDGPQLAYAPPCSQGPGPKTYTFTIHALSQAPTLTVPPNQVTGAVLTTAIAPITLGRGSASVTYTRP